MSHDENSPGSPSGADIPKGFQVKARDHAGVVHDERWTTSRPNAERIVEALRDDPLVAEAWIEEP